MPCLVSWDLHPFFRIFCLGCSPDFYHILSPSSTYPHTLHSWLLHLLSKAFLPLLTRPPTTVFLVSNSAFFGLCDQCFLLHWFIPKVFSWFHFPQELLTQTLCFSVYRKLASLLLLGYSRHACIMTVTFAFSGILFLQGYIKFTN